MINYITFNHFHYGMCIAWFFPTFSINFMFMAYLHHHQFINHTIYIYVNETKQAEEKEEKSRWKGAKGILKEAKGID